MKKIAALMVLSLFLLKGPKASAQRVFQATMTSSGTTLYYKIKPSSTITTKILQMQFSLGFPNSTPAFSYTLTPNNFSFPGLTIDTFASYNDGTNTWYNFYQSSALLASATYTAGVEDTVFTLSLSGSANANFEFGSDSTLNSPGHAGNGNSYQFLMSDNTGTSIVQTPFPIGNELYGAGRFTTATGTFIPINNLPLPIKFLTFTATQSNGDGKLNWIVANETPTTKDYEVQKSTDNGVSFVTIDTVTVINPGALSSYSYTDANLSANLSLVKSTSNTVYYRIIQVDKEGEVLYSTTQAIQLVSTKTDPTISVYPNPVQDFATVKFDLAEEASVTMNLSDISGKILQSTQLEGTIGENKPTINMSSLVNGNYVLTLNIGGVPHIFPLVKAN